MTAARLCGTALAVVAAALTATTTQAQTINWPTLTTTQVPAMGAALPVFKTSSSHPRKVYPS